MAVTLEGLIWATGVFFLGYFALINGSYLLVHAVALVRMRQELLDYLIEPVYQRHSSPFLPGIAIVVPAYNESGTIVSSVQALLNLEYANYEVIVVNDGSNDDTVDRLLEAFELEPVGAPLPLELPCEPVDAVYQSATADLVVIDKENGGKADALNAGLFYTDLALFCAIDADSLIERGGLIEVVEPFLKHPRTMIASGGTVRVANGCTISNGIITKVGLSARPIVKVQTMEYMRAFLSGRVGLNWMRSLLIISGAFGLFRTSAVREIGGYSTDTITEDMELIVRLNRHFIEQGRAYRIWFVPYPVVWTEVPANWRVLGRQRDRWFRGMIETMLIHRRMIANPKYGVVGLVALPFFLFVETLGPLIEGLGYVIVPLAFLLGYLDVSFFVLFLALAVGLGAMLSWLSVLSEVISFRRYRNPRDVVTLLAYALFEHVLFRQWKAWRSWRALVGYLRGDTSWGEMARIGFDQ